MLLSDKLSSLEPKLISLIEILSKLKNSRVSETNRYPESKIKTIMNLFRIDVEESASKKAA